MSDAEKDRPQEFPSTWWSLIDRARGEGSSVRTDALRELVVRYAPPLRAHLVLRRRLDDELADELLQGFMTDKIIAQYLLRHADSSKGKFRSLLVRSLDNYWADWGRKRAVQPATGWDGGLEEVPAVKTDGADVFDIAWARQLLEEVLSTMRADCLANAQANIWGVFESRLLAPVFEHSDPLPYDEICKRFGFISPEHASNALVTARRKFQRAFDRVAVRYRHDNEQTEDVLGDLIDILSRSGPLPWRQVPEASISHSAAPSAPREELEDSDPVLIARLLKLVPTTDELWWPEDLSGLMRHQLAQRLSRLKLDAHDREAQATEERGSPPVTLDDLFRHPAPSVALLESVKRFARKRVNRSESTLPDEIATALYFAAIAAALVRRGERITTADDELLRFGFKRLRERTWIESPLDELFEDALARLGPPGAAR